MVGSTKWCEQCAQSTSAQKPVRFSAAGRTHGQVFACYACSKASTPAFQRADLTGKNLLGFLVHTVRFCLSGKTCQGKRDRVYAAEQKEE